MHLRDVGAQGSGGLLVEGCKSRREPRDRCRAGLNRAGVRVTRGTSRPFRTTGSRRKTLTGSRDETVLRKMGRPTLAAGLVTALAVLLGQATLGPSALATDGATVTWRPAAAPPHTGFWSNACPADEPDGVHTTLQDDTSNLAASRTLVPGKTPPDVAWQYSPSVDVEGGPVFTLDDPATVTSFSAQARSTSTAGLHGRLLAYSPNPAKPDKYFVGVGQVTTSGTAWHSVNSSGSMLWYQQGGGLFGRSWVPVYPKGFFDPTNQPRSIAAFAADHSAAAPMLVSYQFGCTSTAFELDHIRIKSAAGTTDYDLENPRTTTTASSTATSVDAGGSTRLTGTVTTHPSGEPVSSGALQLQARPYGAHRFTRIGTVNLQKSAGPGVPVAPDGTTDYRWAFPGNTAGAPSTSKPVTVKVQSRVTSALAQHKQVLGKTVTLRGSVLPMRPGTPVVLQRFRSGGWHTTNRTTTNARGRFGFHRRASSTGRWLLRTHVAPFDGNLGSDSPTQTMIVTSPTKVTARPRQARVFTDKRYTVIGAASVHRRGVAVKLQRKDHGRWHTIAESHTSRTGGFSFHGRAGRDPGVWKLRVVVAKVGYHLSGTSPTVKLYIEPSPKPVPTGGGSTGGSGSTPSGSSGSTGGGSTGSSGGGSTGIG